MSARNFRSEDRNGDLQTAGKHRAGEKSRLAGLILIVVEHREKREHEPTLEQQVERTG